MASRASGPGRVAVSLIALAPAAYVGWRVARWALVDAGWGVIADRYRFILFGAYPIAEQWRPAIVCLLFAVPFGLTVARAKWSRGVVAAWIATETTAVLLMHGGFAGLPEVPHDVWGGLPLTLMLSTTSFTLAMPVAIVLAFGRRSPMPAVRALCSAWIELIRGIPLVALLFMASVLVPLCLPDTLVIDKAIRIVLTFAVGVAAYEAEVVGAGIDGVPAAQRDAAAALGLSPIQTAVQIVLPQAIGASMPATINTFMAYFKDTTLVMIVGFFDLLGAAHAAIADGRWAGYGVEVYVFTALIYGVLCHAIARGGARLERGADGVSA